MNVAKGSREIKRENSIMSQIDTLIFFFVNFLDI